MAQRLLLPLLHHHHHHHHHFITINTERCGPLGSPQLIHGFSSSSRGRRVAMSTPPPSGDPGDWRFSPEWWGIQGRGWGRDEGSTLFSHASCKSNGIVTVTSHPASSSVCPYCSLLCHVLISFRAELVLISFHSLKPCFCALST